MVDFSQWRSSRLSFFISREQALEDHAGDRTHVQGIDLDQVAGVQHRVVLGFAYSVGTRPQSTPRAGNSEARRFQQPTLPLELREHAPPPWKSKPATSGGATEPPTCLCPSAETATARSKPFLLREKTKSAGGGAEDKDCVLPGSSNPADHSAAANDRRSDG